MSRLFLGPTFNFCTFEKSNFLHFIFVLKKQLNTMLKKTLFTFAFLCFTAFNLSAQDEVLGNWVTIDDETGEKKSVVEVYKKDGEVFGKIVEILRPTSDNPICEKCKDHRKDQPIMNMHIIRDMKMKEDGKWGDGKILDPEKGKEYGCTLWVEDGELKVKGWVGFLSRTQTWVKQ